MKIAFDTLYAQREKTRLHIWVDSLKPQLNSIFEVVAHGKHEEWEAILQQLPELQAPSYNIDTSIVSVGTKDIISDKQSDLLLSLLKQLTPWRKGPYDLFGIPIDTEWHSDWKWERIKDHLAPLDD